MIKEEIENLLNEACKKAGLQDAEMKVSFSNLPELCDFQCNNAFALAKKIGKNPLEIAETIVNNIEENEIITVEAVKPAFINIKLTQKSLEKVAEECLVAELGGLEKHKNTKKIIMDYGGANVAKALHMGHLRSPIIGEGLKRLYRIFGDEVISDVHLGDWGLQMGLTELQLKLDGVLDYYFTGKGKEPEITLDMLNEAYPKASARKNEDKEFLAQAEDITLKIQKKEEPYFTIYKKIREVSVSKIKQHYGELGATFDLWYGESDASKYIDRAVNLFVEKGLTRESEGALIVDVAREGEHIPIPKKNPDDPQMYKNPMPPAIIKKHNGADLYATTDIATILMRNENYNNVDEIQYIVDNRQSQHFTQVFRCCKLSGISPEKQKLTHIGYGTMNGADGKPFKTRSGDTIKLEDIINMLVEKASEKLKSNGVEVSRDLALKIGVGAMKFGDLSNTIAKDYVFDLVKFLAFEGKTGPYIQYTVARINSILNKVGVEGGTIKIWDKDEHDIILAILKLLNAYEICYQDRSLNALCLASYDLASAFSTFYNNHHILNESDKEKQASYVSLLKLVKKELTQALNVLGIELPERM